MKENQYIFVVTKPTQSILRSLFIPFMMCKSEEIYSLICLSPLLCLSTLYLRAFISLFFHLLFPYFSIPTIVVFYSLSTFYLKLPIPARLRFVISTNMQTCVPYGSDIVCITFLLPVSQSPFAILLSLCQLCVLGRLSSSMMSTDGCLAPTSSTRSQTRSLPVQP